MLLINKNDILFITNKPIPEQCQLISLGTIIYFHLKGVFPPVEAMLKIDL